MARKRKPNSMYRNVKSQAYTRREYMGGVPYPKIVRFETGNPKEDFPVQVNLVVKRKCHIRHSALEAARVTGTRHMVKRVGRKNFHLKVRVYPHVVLRENKQATGAGADRISQGMSQSFGKNVGTAARVSAKQEVITLNILPEHFQFAKDALRKASMKLPSPCELEINKGRDLLPGV